MFAFPGGLKRPFLGMMVVNKPLVRLAISCKGCH